MVEVTKYRFELRRQDGSTQRVGGTDAPWGTGTEIEKRAQQLHALGETGTLVLVKQRADDGQQVAEDVASVEL